MMSMSVQAYGVVNVARLPTGVGLKKRWLAKPPDPSERLRPPEVAALRVLGEQAGPEQGEPRRRVVVGDAR
jgi:hypothetical protein